MIKKILVADDSASIRQYLSVVLKELTDVKPRLAEDGREALDIIEDGFIPDVALFDVNMPRLDGVQLLR